jgi:hypothetical protein
MDIFPGAGHQGQNLYCRVPGVTAFCRTANIQVPTTAAALDDKWIEADAGGPAPIPTLGQHENADADTRRLRVC